MRTAMLRASLAVVLLIGVGALIFGTVVRPAQARAESRRVASVQFLARQVTARLSALPGGGAAPATCAGLMSCRAFTEELPALVIRVATLAQQVTGQAAEIQCFPHHPRDLDVYGRGKTTGVNGCMVIERFDNNKHMIMIEVRNPSAQSDDPAGSIAGMQVV